MPTGRLYLSISANGGRRWVFIFKRGGRPREMGLGSAADNAVSLSTARELAANARDLLARGLDPIEERKRIAAETKDIPTFGQAAVDYIKAHRESWKNQKHVDQWSMTLLGIDPKGKPAKNDYCKSIRGLRVDQIDDGHILRILRPIWLGKTETASRLRGRIEKVLDLAKLLKSIAVGTIRPSGPAISWRRFQQRLESRTLKTTPRFLTSNFQSSWPLLGISQVLPPGR